MAGLLAIPLGLGAGAVGVIGGVSSHIFSLIVDEQYLQAVVHGFGISPLVHLAGPYGGTHPL